MRNKHTIREEEQIDCLKEGLNNLEKKWIKTPMQSREIKFLKEYIKLKQEMVNKLKGGNKMEEQTQTEEPAEEPQEEPKEEKPAREENTVCKRMGA